MISNLESDTDWKRDRINAMQAANFPKWPRGVTLGCLEKDPTKTSLPDCVPKGAARPNSASHDIGSFRSAGGGPITSPGSQSLLGLNS